MTPRKRSFFLTGLLIVSVGVALASGGLQIPKLFEAVAASRSSNRAEVAAATS